MRLYLVQHAEAKPKEEDPERPLSEYGYASIRRVASFIVKNTDISVNSILHSGIRRAVETAEALAEKLKPPQGVKKGLELEPISTPWSWVERLSQIKENLMLVGHLPHLNRLASLLLCHDESKKIVEFQMGCVISLERDESGLWAIKWMVTPQIIPQD